MKLCSSTPMGCILYTIRVSNNSSTTATACAICYRQSSGYPSCALNIVQNRYHLIIRTALTRSMVKSKEVTFTRSVSLDE